jgi:dihydropteroate synthase
MATDVRISGDGVLAVTIEGLTRERAVVLRDLACNPDGGISLSGETAAAGGDVVLTGARDRLRRFLEALRSNPRVPGELSSRLQYRFDNYLRSDYKIACRGGVLDLGLRTHVMGILNATPDSFSDGGRFAAADRALAHAREMASGGADVIDIGGESTRPGASPVPEDEELRRIIPLIERLSAELPLPISVDTYKSSVAKKALQAGASIVNDISGLRFSPDMAKVAAEYGAGVVIMHIKGTPRNMQQDPVYADVVGEIMAYLEEGIELAVRAGVDREKVMIDPGIGFGKTLEHNLTVLNRLDEFRALGRPIVLGASRKKFIGTVLNVPVPEERAFGTAATVALGIERGASIVRVHDVASMTQVARMTDAIVKRQILISNV